MGAYTADLSSDVLAALLGFFPLMLLFVAVDARLVMRGRILPAVHAFALAGVVTASIVGILLTLVSLFFPPWRDAFEMLLPLTAFGTALSGGLVAWLTFVSRANDKSE